MKSSEKTSSCKKKKCKICHKEYEKSYYENLMCPICYKQYRKKGYIKNRERRLKQQLVQRNKNREARRRYQSEYRKNNEEAIRAKQPFESIRADLAKHGLKPSDIKEEQLSAMVKEQESLLNLQREIKKFKQKEK